MEMLRQGRDSTRMREVGTIHRALSMFQVDRPTVSLGLPNIIYVSIPDTSTTCTNLGLPTLPLGWSYRCVDAINLRRIDSHGWIPIDFTSIFQGSPLASLPIDPTNTAVSSNFYVYVTDGRTWAIASLMESERHAPSATRDGGTDAARFEAGNNLALWTTASGLVGYWSFDEGTGTTARDLSGRGNNGNLLPALSPPTWTTGRGGGALRFDGVDDIVSILHSTSLNITGAITIEAWVRRNALDHRHDILGKSGEGYNFFIESSTLQHRLVFQAQDTGGTWRNVGSAANAVPNTNWHHVVVTYERPTVRFYVNGRDWGIGIRDFDMRSTTGPLHIGGMSGWAVFFNGLIDEVRIYNRALTEAEIRANFNATR